MVRIVKALIVIVFTLGSAWYVYSACVNGCPNQSGIGATVTGNPPTTSNELIVSSGPNQAIWEPFSTFITSVPTPAPFPISNYTGQVGITTGVGYGNDYINGACHDGDCSVMAFGASGLGASTLTGSVNSNSTALVLTSQYDGPNYGYLRILGAGTNQNFTQPSAPTVQGGLEEVDQQTIPNTPYQITPSPVAANDILVTDQGNGWPYQPNCPSPGRYQYCFSSGTYTFNSGDVAHVVVIRYEANSGQSGASNHTYQLVAADDAGGYSQASATTTVSIGTQAPPDFDESNIPSNGILESSNAVVVQLPALPTGATQWLICKDGNVYGYSEKVWLHLSPSTAPVLQPVFTDTGVAHVPNNDFPTTCPSAASADHLIVQVLAGSGTNAVTLASSPAVGTTVTGATVYYDDTAAFQAACNAVIPSGGGNVTGRIIVPTGTYNLTSTVTCGAAGGLRTVGFTMDGSGLGSSVFQWEGPKDGDPFLFVSAYGSYLGRVRMSGAPSASGFRYGTNNGAGSVSNVTVYKVQVDNGARYPLEFGKGNDTGQISEVDIDDATVGGGPDDWRNWGGVLIEGGNNLNYNLRNIGCAGLGVSNGAQVNNGSCVWDDNDYYGGSGTGGNAVNIIGGSVSHSPAYGIGCIQCGWLHFAIAGAYNVYGARIESTSNLFVLQNSGAGVEYNLYGILYTNNGFLTSANYIINDGSAVGAVNSVGSSWTSYMTFNAANNGPMTFMNDYFNITGGNCPSTIQGYFTPTLASSYNINVLQKNGGLGIMNALTFSSKTVATLSGAGTLATGSNSFAGTITGSGGASNQITPGFTCPNAVVCTLSDRTTAGGAMVTAASTTSCTYSATGGDTVDYIASCR